MIDVDGLESNELNSASLKLQSALHKNVATDIEELIVSSLESLEKIAIWFEILNREGIRIPKKLAWSNKKEQVEEEFQARLLRRKNER